MDDVFKNTKCFTDPLSKNGTKLTTEELFSKYLHDYSTDDITFYHGTTSKAANSIQKNGFRKGSLGHLTGNFDGVFLTTNKDIATRYADLKVNTPYIGDTQGVILNLKLPNGKLAQFTNDEGKFFSYCLLDDLFKDGALGQELSKNSLGRLDFIKFLEEKIAKMGYDGIRTYDAHTGATPIIFNPSIIKVKDIVKI